MNSLAVTSVINKSSSVLPSRSDVKAVTAWALMSIRLIRHSPTKPTPAGEIMPSTRSPDDDVWTTENAIKAATTTYAALMTRIFRP